MVKFMDAFAEDIGVTKRGLYLILVLLVLVMALIVGIGFCIDHLGIGKTEYYEGKMLQYIKFECGTKNVLVPEWDRVAHETIYRMREVPKICQGMGLVTVRIKTKSWWEIKKDV